jgi:AcrR family transcriptional regulator
MTEIAKRAGAAIGSLYQFFPSKEALAEALLVRYGERIAQSIEDFAARAAGWTARGFADAVVDLRLELRKERGAILALTDVSGKVGARAHLREAIRTRMAAALRAMNPSLSGSRARAMAIVILQVLKAVPALVEEDPDESIGLVGEMRALVERYVAGAAPGHRRGRAQ